MPGRLGFPNPPLLNLAALFMGTLLLTSAGGDSARFNTLGHRMMCVCSCNQILLECNHVGCSYSQRMRGELQAALDRGDNDELVLQSFVQKYGTTVIAAPTTKGFNRIAWIMPYFALVAGIGIVIVIVRTWREGGPGNGGGTPISYPELDRFRAQARKETETL